MYTLIHAALIALVLVVAQPVLALEREVVNWFRVDIPIVYIFENGRVTGGFGEESMQFAMKKLPQYQHEISTMNLSRGLERFQAGEHICFSTLLRNSEREQFVEFSIPAQLALPIHLVVRQADLDDFRPYMNEEGLIDLNAMLRVGKSRIGVAAKRSYSRHIDDILANHKGRPNIYARSSMDAAEGLLQMIHAGRVDCILEFPVTIGYMQRNDHGSYPREELAFIPIKGMPKFFLSHFAAPKNEWGKGMIREINEIVRENRTSDEFIDFYARWLDGPIKERYIQDTREFFAKEQ